MLSLPTLIADMGIIGKFNLVNLVNYLNGRRDCGSVLWPPVVCLSLIGWRHCAYPLRYEGSSGGGSAAPGYRRRSECYGQSKQP